MNTIPSKQMGRYNRLICQTQAVYHEAALRLGMADSAMGVLYELHAQGGACALQEICLGCGMPKQTINSALRKLEAQGIVTLQAHGRSKDVCLTPAGKELAEKTAGCLIEAENEVLASWPEADTELYLNLTEAFLVGLRDKVKTFTTATSITPKNPQEDSYDSAF